MENNENKKELENALEQGSLSRLLGSFGKENIRLIELNLFQIHSRETS